MKREYSLATEKLINKMCQLVERQEFTLDKKRGQEFLMKTYDLFNLPRPKKVVWVTDIFDKKYQYALESARSAGSAGSARSARSAGSARSAWSAGSAGSARSAWSARSAGSARSAWSARSAGSARSAWSAWSALDYDFDWFVIEHEYIKNRKDNKGDDPNENDRKYLKYSELLLQAIECGIGYRVEYDDILYISSDRICEIDKENRFHSLNGPAIYWKGGHEFYYVHDVNVPEKLIKHPEKLTKKDWMKESNLEVRRIIQDRMPDFVKKLGAKSIQKDSFGELLEIDLGSDPEKVARYVKVKDSSTSRVYYLRVPPKMETAKEAVAWTFGVESNNYKPLKES